MKMPQKKPKKRKGKKKPQKADWNLVAELAKIAEEAIYECPICEIPVPAPKRHLRNHIRDDHTNDEAVAYLAMWTDYYYDDGVAQDVDVNILVGKNLRIRLEGKDIMKKIKHCGVEANYENIVRIHNSIVDTLVEELTNLIDSPNWIPIKEDG